MTHRFLHGTTSAAVTLASERGAWLPQTPERVSARVEAACGLPAGSVHAHSAFAFSRDRAGDNRLYLTQDPRVADAYAHAGSEMLEDALRAAHRLLFSDRSAYAHAEHLNPVDARVRRRELDAHRDAWAADWRAGQQIDPAVVSFALTDDDVAASVDYTRYTSDTRGEPLSPAAWLAAATDHGRVPLGCLMLPCPVRSAWQLDPVPSGPARALASAA